MARNKPNKDEVQTTLRINPDLHLWLKHYALDHKTTYAGIIQDVVFTWAKEHGFEPPTVVETSHPKDNAE
ncbi:MAG: hypothetical protein H0U76_25410 [Ktedonobacteraceae bacterium]|nr:hypothetical protein [Ktedonobacteraceae bacterium]MBA3823724.1 hypothetical protein [Ktedonobacterales bacterium]